MIIEEINGIFDGQIMVANDGRLFPVSPNYASKSKLIEGDGLVLKITDDGSFIFKQVQPIQRKRIIAKVVIDDSGKMFAEAENNIYQMLDASISFYKLQEGDSITIAIPTDSKSLWAAVEYVIK